MIGVSPAVAASIERLHGERGRRWVADLGRRIALSIARWSLDLDASPASRSGAVVWSARARDEPVMLKLVVDEDAYLAEQAALEWFEGRGCVKLIAASAGEAALLLERVEPGEHLRALVRAGRDEAATQAAADVVSRLQVRVGASARTPLLDIGLEVSQTFEAYRRRFSHAGGPIP